MIPTVVIPIIENERKEHYEHLAQRAVASIEAQTVATRYLVSYGDTLSEAKNQGVDSVDSEYAMVLDADDVLDPEFMEAVDKVPSWDVIKPRVYVNGVLNVFPERDIRQMNYLINGCPFKTELWYGVGGAEEVPYPDWYLWAKIVTKYDPNVVYVRDAIYYYLQTGDGLNQNRSAEEMHEILRLLQDL